MREKRPTFWFCDTYLIKIVQFPRKGGGGGGSVAKELARYTGINLNHVVLAAWW